MNRYPLWKYVIVAVALLLGFDLHPCPTSSANRRRCRFPAPRPRSRSMTRPRNARRRSAEGRRRSQQRHLQLDTVGVKVRLQGHRHPVEGQGYPGKNLQPDPADPQYVVALNLLSSSSPTWLTAARAADVPRPRPARRRALPAAGRHEGRADQAPRLHRPTCAPDARQERPPRRHQTAKASAL
jgi:hypothetical protein